MSIEAGRSALEESRKLAPALAALNARLSHMRQHLPSRMPSQQQEQQQQQQRVEQAQYRPRPNLPGLAGAITSQDVYDLAPPSSVKVKHFVPFIIIDLVSSFLMIVF